MRASVNLDFLLSRASTMESACMMFNHTLMDSFYEQIFGEIVGHIARTGLESKQEGLVLTSNSFIHALGRNSSLPWSRSSRRKYGTTSSASLQSVVTLDNLETSG